MDWKTIAELERRYREAERALLEAVTEWRDQLSARPSVPSADRRRAPRGRAQDRLGGDGTGPALEPPIPRSGVSPTRPGPSVSRTILEAMAGGATFGAVDLAKTTGLRREQVTGFLKKSAAVVRVGKSGSGRYRLRKG